MIDVQEGRRLKAAAEEMQEGVKDASIKDALETVDAWDRWLDANIAALLDAAERTEAEKASEAWDDWRDANIDALLDAAERAEAAERELAEVQGDAERFEWWFNRDVDKRDFMPTYFQGIRERWSLSNWRAAIDAERGK